MGSSAERMRRKRTRDAGRGIIEVTVKVPAQKVAELRELAAGWCENYGGHGVTSDKQLSILD
jgi:hypothetical protein